MFFISEISYLVAWFVMFRMLISGMPFISNKYMVARHPGQVRTYKLLPSGDQQFGDE